MGQHDAVVEVESDSQLNEANISYILLHCIVYFLHQYVSDINMVVLPLTVLTYFSKITHIVCSPWPSISNIILCVNDIPVSQTNFTLPDVKVKNLCLRQKYWMINDYTASKHTP